MPSKPAVLMKRVSLKYERATPIQLAVRAVTQWANGDFLDSEKYFLRSLQDEPQCILALLGYRALLLRYPSLLQDQPPQMSDPTEQLLERAIKAPDSFKHETGKCLHRLAEEETSHTQDLGLYLMAEWYHLLCQDLYISLFYYQKAANLGSVFDQTTLGTLPAFVPGVPKDPSIAVLYFEKAAQEGYCGAQYQLGNCYWHGLNNIRKDPLMAVRMYQLAADQGHAPAQYSLGHAYAEGIGARQNMETALSLWIQATEMGNQDADNALRSFYSDPSKQKDRGYQVYWLLKNAHSGDAESQHSLGFCYYTGEGVLNKNSARALHWFQKAAEQDFPAAEFFLSIIYEQGDGVEVDHDEALKWLEKAANHNHTTAQCNLGMHYLQQADSHKCRHNSAEQQRLQELAISWLRKSALSGQPTAQNKLGQCYSTGCGVPKDMKMALSWWKQAAALGDVEAKRYLERHKKTRFCTIL
eukprot:TRINITY_DN5047_c0_g1::TRINITY_DN5047_c0_g1_i1::g.24877::m.24877 TRINITY_DN5047_c0_g1::TRINITY_DN5047_c0_g1_i1::g.24877  ORF type:complete len:469 (+),score=-3.55,sp/A0A0H2VDN9/ESIB_ECOL6/30.51/4e-31,sp/A0A0H2VDN9/ESIB_ECOL6/32.42/1e-23,sp/A0A0H2VDN9/ESIB_ECOL6/29.74/4e-22,sp/A0A0H2VDN9/ESIB_ECOL6/29.48/1e-20,Sel1/PF08238.7/4.6,Sel1/PF08238.7/0.026,Sel1/PF08238.7/4.4e-08,Sel1/PF08238.7/0.00027,Sel1/PF08238.7/1.6e-07,Sel1/PF08238.7/6.1e-08,Sel1/PF08238.7/0.89,Sel1/PF08238.7/3e-09,TPR_16/PF13432.1/